MNRCEKKVNNSCCAFSKSVQYITVVFKSSDLQKSVTRFVASVSLSLKLNEKSVLNSRQLQNCLN